jgi:hypothetical protein
LPVNRGPIRLLRDAPIHQIELHAHAGKSSGNVVVGRFVRTDLRGLRGGFCRWDSAGEPLTPGSVSFSRQFAGIGGSEAHRLTLPSPERERKLAVIGPGAEFLKITF